MRVGWNQGPNLTRQSKGSLRGSTTMIAIHNQKTEIDEYNKVAVREIRGFGSFKPMDLSLCSAGGLTEPRIMKLEGIIQGKKVL